MLEPVSPGDKFKPKAADFNAMYAATRWAQEQQKRQRESVQLAQPRITVDVKNVGDTDIPRFGFGFITEPLILPTDEDTQETHEFLNRLVFKVEAPDESEQFWPYYSPYWHVVVLLEPAPSPESASREGHDKIVKAVYGGLVQVKLAYGDPGDDMPNTFPTTAHPADTHLAACGSGFGTGPLKIVWMQEEENNDGFRWAVVNVCNEFRQAPYVQGTLTGALAFGDSAPMTLDTPFGDVTSVEVEGRWFDQDNGEPIGAVWDENTQSYVAIAKACSAP
jgi:hypothetical protein